jgi:hypothetical protein
MHMEYEGPGATEFFVFSEGDGVEAFAMFANSGWSAQERGEYLLEFQFDEWVLRRPALGTKLGFKRGFGVFLDEELRKQIAGSDNLVIMREDVLVDDLALTGSAKALRRLDRCRAELAAAAAADSASGEPMKPLSSPASVAALALSSGIRNPAPAFT